MKASEFYKSELRKWSLRLNDSGDTFEDMSDIFEFAEEYYKARNKANGVSTDLRQSNIPAVIKSVCVKCNTEPLLWIEDKKRFLKCACGNIKQTVL